MADLTVAVVVARENAAIAALSGWSVPPLPVSLMPDNTRQTAHKVAHCMAVRSDVENEPTSGRRQNRATGARVRSRLVIEWLWRVRTDAYASDIAAAYDGEAALIKALLGVSLVDLHLSLVSASREVAADRTRVLGVIEIDAIHSIALA